MCGIAGAMGDLTERSLKEMLSLMQHRGPDHWALTSFDDIHFAHARLSIIDLSAQSNQPLWDIQRKACIVFNGEIYNYQLLREELQGAGYSFASQGDAEVIVNLYLHCGVACFKRLRGIFSFALWDAEREELLVVRDACGVKPLYYTENEHGFYFASELKSLLVADGVFRELNYDVLLRTLVFLWSPGPETVLKNIFKLESGRYLIIKNRKIFKQEKFAEWPVYNPQKISVANACHRLDDTLLSSVQEQLVADVPIGAFLSGGLDSSLLVAMMVSLGKQDLECFTTNPEWSRSNQEGFVDELPYAQYVAEYLKTKLNIVSVGSERVIQLLYKMIYHLDEPYTDPASLNVFLICDKARKKGIKVLFSGAGGDDVFTGYRRHRAIRLESYSKGIFKPVSRILQAIAYKLPKKKIAFRRFAKWISHVGSPVNERILSYFYWIDPKIARGLFIDNIQEKLSAAPMDFILNKLDDLPKLNSLEKMLYLEKCYFLTDHNLNYTDKLSMACGVEVRVPFLDPRLLELASRLPVGLKQRYGHGKWILKKMAEKYLPKSIIYRPKTGFGVPLRHWLKNDLKCLVDEVLSEESILRRGIFKPQAIHHLIQEDRADKQDYAYVIFTLLCFEIWCRLFLDDMTLDKTLNFERLSSGQPYNFGEKSDERVLC